MCRGPSLVLTAHAPPPQPQTQPGGLGTCTTQGAWVVFGEGFGGLLGFSMAGDHLTLQPPMTNHAL